MHQLQSTCTAPCGACGYTDPHNTTQRAGSLQVQAETPFWKEIFNFILQEVCMLLLALLAVAGLKNIHISRDEPVMKTCSVEIWCGKTH